MRTNRTHVSSQRYAGVALPASTTPHRLFGSRLAAPRPEPNGAPPEPSPLHRSLRRGRGRDLSCCARPLKPRASPVRRQNHGRCDGNQPGGAVCYGCARRARRLGHQGAHHRCGRAARGFGALRVCDAFAFPHSAVEVRLKPESTARFEDVEAAVLKCVRRVMRARLCPALGSADPARARSGRGALRRAARFSQVAWLRGSAVR